TLYRIEYHFRSTAVRPPFPWRLALALTIASIFLAWPCFNCFDPGSIAWEVVFRKAADPLDDLRDVPEYLWLSKKVFRLTVPLLISIMGLGPIGTFVLQFAV